MSGTPVSHSRPPAREPFGRGAWLLLGFIGLLVMLCAAQLAYRFTMPTDGWRAENMVEACELTLLGNVTAAPSGLQLGDVVTAVNGEVFDPACAGFPRPAGWEVGGSVVYTVRRGEQVLDVSVPVTHWTLERVLRYNFGSVAALTSGFSAAVLFFALGLFTFFNRPATPAARALLMFSGVLFVNSLSSTLPSDIGVWFDPLIRFPVSFFSYAIIGSFFGPALLSFSLVFPRPKAVVARRPWLAVAPYTLSVVVLLAVYVFNLVPLAFTTMMLLLIASIVSLAHSAITMRDAVSRAQMQWGVGGVVVGLGVALLTFVPNWLPELEWLGWVNPFSLGFVLMGLSLSVAILRYRVFDIDLVIRRTLTYSVLTLLLAAVYFGTVVVLEGAFRGVSGGASSLAIVLSTLAIAALFAPLRRRVQGAIDRRFNRRAYDAARTLAEFGATLRDQVEIDALTGQLLTVVDDTMQPAHARLWLRE